MTGEEEYRRVVEELLDIDPDVSQTQMMGMPSLKAGGKLFAGFSENALVVKVGKDRVAELIGSGRGEPFDPSGRDRPMRDWIVLSLPADDWSKLAQEARRAVG
jgi:TfoX/Sxy family transcriptional regulator of competence genes